MLICNSQHCLLCRTPHPLHHLQPRLQTQVEEASTDQTAEAGLGERCCLPVSVSPGPISQNNLTLLTQAGDLAQGCWGQVREHLHPEVPRQDWLDPIH